MLIGVQEIKVMIDFLMTSTIYGKMIVGNMMELSENRKQKLKMHKNRDKICGNDSDKENTRTTINDEF